MKFIIFIYILHLLLIQLQMSPFIFPLPTTYLYSVSATLPAGHYHTIVCVHG